MTALHDLSELLADLDPDAPAVQRHLWLVALFDWIRGDCSSVPASIARVQLLMDAFQIRLAERARLQVWWQKLNATLDGTTLLADYGFSSNSAFISELINRILQKILPGTPETADASALFSLVLCHRFDAQWLSALDEPLLARIADLLQPAQAPRGRKEWPATHPWQTTLLEAITFCTSQIRATGFSPELRLRMSAPAREASPFHDLARDFDLLRDAYLASPDQDDLPPRAGAAHPGFARLPAVGPSGAQYRPFAGASGHYWAGAPQRAGADRLQHFALSGQSGRAQL
jgi:site-specific recombinase